MFTQKVLIQTQAIKITKIQINTKIIIQNTYSNLHNMFQFLIILQTRILLEVKLLIQTIIQSMIRNLHQLQKNNINLKKKLNQTDLKVLKQVYNQKRITHVIKKNKKKSKKLSQTNQNTIIQMKILIFQVKNNALKFSNLVEIIQV
ncbi:hypothetical protein TTHERM_000128738 (macronuclear) [Tetrahymena thermophila SB210]|uniref:Uncharacterized protein n=1 Tax=Tetrahymena thermophila (strain SB210) TaxID=312017 RepID=W7X4S4_TETTS|nr:hypothetical protein TTHERM_000128738 [Tetrahymena thermophila SB210]EWS74320.1 hypothetical protein TTHERM_000128738 [Tetrahymena thermophila SB210]|eukprot:XP_012653141.1 hypothetical protein TTHERM_000128738 [Tetrahymena thermophila SB210]